MVLNITISPHFHQAIRTCKSKKHETDEYNFHIYILLSDKIFMLMFEYAKESVLMGNIRLWPYEIIDIICVCVCVNKGVLNSLPHCLYYIFT